MFKLRSRLSDRDDAEEVDRIVATWHRCCESIGLTDDRETVTGTTHVVPRIEHVTLGPPTVLSVRLTPGMLPEDVTAQGRRIARSMGAQSLRVEPRGFSHVLVTLLPSDPLSEEYSGIPEIGPILLGRDENGQDVTVDNLGHVAIQGSSGSGKSALLYSLLAQMACRRRAGSPVEITGVDPSGILLRPFPGSILGLADPDRIETFLRNLVADMDDRISRIAPDADLLPATSDAPTRYVVFEELPGLYRYFDSIDMKAGKRVRSYIARCLSEGRKAGIRCILVAQRCDSATIGSTERAQTSLRISMRVDTLDAIKLLHPDVTPEAVAGHAVAAPGIGLLSMPGVPLSRIRVPWIGSYAAYVRSVAPESAA